MRKMASDWDSLKTWVWVPRPASYNQLYSNSRGISVSPVLWLPAFTCTYTHTHKFKLTSLKNKIRLQCDSYTYSTSNICLKWHVLNLKILICYFLCGKDVYKVEKRRQDSRWYFLHFFTLGGNRCKTLRYNLHIRLQCRCCICSLEMQGLRFRKYS